MVYTIEISSLKWAFPKKACCKRRANYEWKRWSRGEVLAIVTSYRIKVYWRPCSTSERDKLPGSEWPFKRDYENWLTIQSISFLKGKILFAPLLVYTLYSVWISFLSAFQTHSKVNIITYTQIRKQDFERICKYAFPFDANFFYSLINIIFLWHANSCMG